MEGRLSIFRHFTGRDAALRRPGRRSAPTLPKTGMRPPRTPSGGVKEMQNAKCRMQNGWEGDTDKAWGDCGRGGHGGPAFAEATASRRSGLEQKPADVGAAGTDALVGCRTKFFAAGVRRLREPLSLALSPQAGRERGSARDGSMDTHILAPRRAAACEEFCPAPRSFRTNERI